MEFKPVSSLENPKIPNAFIWGMLGLCVLPFLLNLTGVDFGSQKSAFPWSTVDELLPHERTDAMFYTLAGSFTHTLLEWSAFMTAIFIVFLAFLHFHIKRDVTTPILGVALLCAGTMDAFHTLAADRLIESVADNRNLIPFTWAISRMFNALILMLGVSIFLVKGTPNIRKDIRFVLLTSLAFGGLAYAIISYCANSATLPQTMYPDSLITRPFDVIPLVLYAVAGLTVFRRFYHQQPGLFTHGLLLGMIPEVVVELHMAFGSTALFDNHFNIAHFIKIIAYLMPLIGLALEYVNTYQQEALAVANLQAEISQREKAEETTRRMAAIVESSGDAIIRQKLDGTIQSWNSGAEQVFGYSAEEMLGNRMLPLIPPERQDEEARLIHELRIGKGVSHFETERIRKNQQRIFVSVTLSPIRDKAGELIGYSKIARDITDQKQAERALTKHAAELERSNQELDDFAYIASHDLKEPLRGIHNYSKILLEDHAESLNDDARGRCETILRLSRHMETLLDTLLYFSRVGRSELAMRPTDLESVLGNILESLDVSLKEHGVFVHVPQSFPTVLCDSARIGEIFRNLITNAMKYNDKSEKWIEIGYLGGEKNAFVSVPSLVFFVRDNGIGIREKHLDSIFRIFKRLHGRDKFGGGTGAGLTMTKKMVERHGGRIWVESTFGEGTTVYFTLETSQGVKDTCGQSMAISEAVVS